jgi:hypothetical protein
MLFTSTMPTPAHAEKNRGRRVLFPLKRANNAAFGLCDRAAGLALALTGDSPPTAAPRAPRPRPARAAEAEASARPPAPRRAGGGTGPGQQRRKAQGVGLA